MHISKTPLCFLSFLLLCSCSSIEKDDGHIFYTNDGSITKVPLYNLDNPIYKDDSKDISLYHRLSIEDYEIMIEKKASFLLFIYAPGCFSCENVIHQFDAYIKNTSSLIHYMLLDDYNKTENHQSFYENTLLSFSSGSLTHSYNLTKTELSISQLFSVLSVPSVSIYNTCSMPSYPSLYLPSYEIRMEINYKIENSSSYEFNIHNEKTTLSNKTILFIKSDFNDCSFESKLTNSDIDGIYFYIEKDLSFQSLTGLDSIELKTYTKITFDQNGNLENKKTMDALS